MAGQVRQLAPARQLAGPSARVWVSGVVAKIQRLGAQAVVSSPEVVRRLETLVVAGALSCRECCGS